MMWITWVYSFFWTVYIVKAIIRWATREERDRDADNRLRRTAARTPAVRRDVKPVKGNWTATRTDGTDRIRDDRANETTAESTGMKYVKYIAARTL